MTMCSSKNLISFLILLCSYLGFSQASLTGYLQPQFSINYKVNNMYSQNFMLVNRTYVFTNDQLEFTGRQIDLAHFSRFIIKDNQSLALGIQYRFRNDFDGGENELRFSQQYNVTTQPQTVRFGHRFGSEQRIYTSFTVHRFRYRFALDFPLQGEKLDPGEPYFIGLFENLLSVAKGFRPQYDTRLTGHFGWQLGYNFKLQLGLEYRMEDFTAHIPQNILLLLTSAQLTL